jgi:uncharacterized protein YndB with AHSA1/START domain
MARTAYTIEVTEQISAPIQTVFDVMSDFAQFNEWNPFPSMDPSTVSTVGDPSTGVGATYSYVGKRIGNGKMAITALESPTLISIQMNFGAPSPAVAEVEYRLREKDGGTEVTWFMTGTRGLMDRVMNKVLKLDVMMTGHFADGLSRLKAFLEQ